MVFMTRQVLISLNSPFPRLREVYKDLRLIRWGLICPFTEKKDRIANEGYENPKASNRNPAD
jgi:hypothetical protein